VQDGVGHCKCAGMVVVRCIGFVKGGLSEESRELKVVFEIRAEQFELPSCLGWVFPKAQVVGKGPLSEWCCCQVYCVCHQWPFHSAVSE